MFAIVCTNGCSALPVSTDVLERRGELAESNPGMIERIKQRRIVFVLNMNRFGLLVVIRNNAGPVF